MAIRSRSRRLSKTQARVEPQLPRLENVLATAVRREDYGVASSVSVAITEQEREARQCLAADRKLQRNETIKLTATFVNGFANTLLAGGVAAPLLGLVIPSSPYFGNVSLIGETLGACGACAFAMHMVTRHILRGLKS